MNLRKDETLNRLVEMGFNVAQFVSYMPFLTAHQTYSAVKGFERNYAFKNIMEAATELLRRSSDGSVNIRSFKPEDPRSKEFILGLTNAEDVVANVKRIIDEGLFVIINETVDPCDSGVSGVIHGNIIEFSPDDTPRCVEKPGVAGFPFMIGMNVLTKVYGRSTDYMYIFDIVKRFPDSRIEFSVHPKPRGWLNKSVLFWEFDQDDRVEHSATIGSWPNRFSRILGDKTYGLIVADTIGCKVPETTAFSRRIAPFTFGTKNIKSYEKWLRTAPMVQQPGLFTTTRGWVDPYALMQKEDPEGDKIAAILSQEGIDPVFSGALITTSDMETVIEGCSGSGIDFMVGETKSSELPEYVRNLVMKEYKRIKNIIGPVRFEWVFDGDQVWIVQMHKGQSVSSGDVFVPGEARNWVTFKAEDGLPALRELVSNLPEDTGIRVEGQVGMTSHLADLLRRSGKPSIRV